MKFGTTWENFESDLFFANMREVLVVFISSTRTQKVITRTLLSLSIAWVIYEGVQFGFSLYQGIEKVNTLPIPPENGQMMVGDPITLEDYSALSESLWFGQSIKLQESQMAVKEVTVETTLNLALKGTIMGSFPRVIIRDNQKGTTQVLKVGDELMPGVTLAEVERRKAVLNNRGRMEALSLPGISLWEDDATSSEPKRISASKAMEKLSRQRAAQENYVPLHDRPIDERVKVAVARSDVMTALSDLANITSQARFITRTKAGDVIGFRVLNIAHGSLIQKLSIQERDTLVKLDDIPVAEKSKLLPMLMGLATAKTASFVVERSGKIVQINAEIR